MYLCTVSAFFQLLSMSLNAVARNDNVPKRAMVSIFIGATLNIVLDYIFIFKFHFGIVGGNVVSIFTHKPDLIAESAFKKFYDEICR